MRSGTENVSGIVGFAKAAEIANRKDVEKMIQLRDKMINELLKIPGIKLNGPLENRLCNNINISFEKVEGEVVGGYLENDGIMTSTGSACMSHSTGISHVLKAIGLSDEKASNSLRVSISRFTTEEEVDYFLERFKRIIGKFQKV